MTTLWPECDDREDLQHDPRTPFELDHEPSGRVFEASCLNPRGFIAALRRQARFAAVVGKVPRFRAILSELFLGNIEIEFEDDPEISGKQFIVFTVQATGETKEIAKRRREWYNRTNDLLGAEAELVQLIVTIRE